MSKLNVLCAPPNGRNPGMASVDMALQPLIQDLGVEATYWRLWDQSEWIDPPGGSAKVDEVTVVDETSRLKYRLARGRLQEFLDADAVVFWGDFHHMAVYLDQTADVLHRRMGTAPRAETDDLTARHLLLRGQSRDVLERTVSFGTTLGFNNARDYRSTYGVDLQHFIGNARGASFRDGYSARVAELMRAPRTETCLGSDAAFLAEGPKQSPGATDVGIFIGRSAVAPERVANLGKALISRLGGSPRWIPWGTAPAMWPMWGRKRLRLAWPELETGSRGLSTSEHVKHVHQVVRGPGLVDEVIPASELFMKIASCQVVLTDTYHLAVNAWRTGTPTILLYDRRPGTGWNVNSGEGVGRDKRHDLYSQLDALPLLVDVDMPHSRSDLRRLADNVEGLREPVAARAEAIGQRGYDLVARTLKSVLGH